MRSPPTADRKRLLKRASTGGIRQKPTLPRGLAPASNCPIEPVGFTHFFEEGRPGQLHMQLQSPQVLACSIQCTNAELQRSTARFLKVGKATGSDCPMKPKSPTPWPLSKSTSLPR